MTSVQLRWLWLGFVAVHAVLAVLAWRHGAAALSDVTQVYQPWARQALSGRGVVGIDEPWVYPVLALVPVLVPAAAGPGHYLVAWLVMVTVLDAAALAVLTGRRRAVERVAGWWWLAFLLLLGPVAIGRVDSVAAALAVAAVSVLATRARLAHVLLSAAMWIKVWPVAVIAAAVTATGRRLSAVVTVAGFSAVVVAVAVVCGGARNLFSFVTAQSGRDLQIEAPVSTVWMWAAAAQSHGAHGAHNAHGAGHPVTPGSVRVFYDAALRTVEVQGPGTAAAGAVVTVLMPMVFVAVAALGWVALRRHRAATVFPSVATALVLTLVVLDKVGSPQYQTWLAAPVVAGLLHEPARVRVMAVSAWGAAALTDVLYPYLATELRADQILAVTVLTARNALLIAMFVAATATLIRLATSSPPVAPTHVTTVSPSVRPVRPA